MKLSDFRRKARSERQDMSAENPEELSDIKTDLPETGTDARQPKTKIEKTHDTERGERLCPLPGDEALHPSVLDSARIVVAIILILLSVFLKTLPPSAVIAIRVIAALGVGYDIILSAVSDLRRKNFSCEGLPVILASVLAFAGGLSLEAAIAMTILQISLRLRDYAFCKTKRLILYTVSLPEEPSGLAVGDSFALESGQVVPADCIIVQGKLIADFSFICGERSEKTMKVGDRLPAGCLCLGGNAMAEVTALPEETAVYEIEKTLEAGYSAVTRTERRITELSKFLTPLILLMGIVLIVVLPLAMDLPFRESLRRVIAMIAVASPCGVLLSIPLVYLASMAEQRRQGTVFKNAALMDNTAYTKAVVFDKVGTITADTFEVVDVFSDRMDPKTFLKVAAHAAYGSVSPMARAIVKAYGEPLSGDYIRDFSEYPGWGVSVTVNDIKILLGTGSFLERNRLQSPRTEGGDNVIFMAVSGIVAGRISLRDSVNPNMSDTVRELAKAGVDRVAMVSDDGRERDSAVAKEIGISEYFAECSDEAKAQSVKELRGRIDTRGTVAYVCASRGSREACRAADVAVVMNCSDVSAMGGDADVLILGRAADALPKALLAAKRAKRLALLGATGGFALKLIAVALAGAGIIPLWFSVLLDACVALGLIVASLSISKTKD